MSKAEEQEQEECCQNYYKCKFCHTILEGDYGVDCYDCDGEMCMELIQLTETELEELLEKLKLENP